MVKVSIEVRNNGAIRFEVEVQAVPDDVDHRGRRGGLPPVAQGGGAGASHRRPPRTRGLRGLRAPVRDPPLAAHAVESE